MNYQLILLDKTTHLSDDPKIRREKVFPLELYQEWLYLFNEHTPYREYKNRINENLEPQILINYGKNFFKNDCK